MGYVCECVQAFMPLLDTEYHLILGRKGERTELKVHFEKTHCFHLMGLQYLTDQAGLDRRRDIIFDEIASGKLSSKTIENSDLYYKIENRLKFLPYLEQIFDSNETIFKYNKKQNLYSMIQADYLMKNNLLNSNIFLFLSKEQDGKFFCRSFFPETKKDYTKNQSSWTLLYKGKFNVSNGENIILYNRLK